MPSVAARRGLGPRARRGERAAVRVRRRRARQRDDAHAVAVAAWWRAISWSGAERAGEHEADAALLEHVGRAVADTGLEARVGDLGEAERVT
jgi:hypothetical protein